MQETQRVGKGEASTRKASLKEASASSTSLSFQERKGEEQQRRHNSRRNSHSGRNKGSSGGRDVKTFWAKRDKSRSSASYNGPGVSLYHGTDPHTEAIWKMSWSGWEVGRRLTTTTRRPPTFSYFFLFLLRGCLFAYEGYLVPARTFFLCFLPLYDLFLSG